MMLDLKLTIFVSSPGDVHDERTHTSAVIERLGRELGNHVRLEAYFWEDEPLAATSDFQAQIVLPSATDIAVFILWARLGTRLPPHIKRPDGSTYASGSEFEFEDAFNSHQRTGTPDLLVYRKTARAVAELDDETKVRQLLEQKHALDAFCDHWLGNPDDSFKAAFHTFQTLEEFERRLEIHLRKLIREKVAKRTGKLADEEILWPDAKGSPYRGLEPFEHKHAPIFYGRGQAVDEIASALRAQAAAGSAFVLIFGMSGCGKSSVVRAGVLPRLEQAAASDGIGLLRRNVFRPSDAAGDLCAGLAQALFGPAAVPELAAGGYSVVDFADALRDGPRHAIGPLRIALHRAAETAARQQNLAQPPEPWLVLVIDQLEEIFTLERIIEHERAQFIDALSALAKSGLVWVLATMRSDFYPRCAEVRELDALKKGLGQYDLLPPTFAEIGQMIRLPARDAGLHFEQDPMSKQWLDDLLHEAAANDPESLPLLEFTLDRLYQTRAADRVLTFASYRALGGLEGALAQHAEAVFAALEPAVQQALPSILPALVTVAPGENELPTSRRVPLEGLTASPERRALVEALIHARLLVADRADNGEAVAGFVHEALLRHWARLRDWIEADRDFLRIRTRITDAAARWRQEGQSADFLLPEGKPLAEARDLLAKRKADLDAGCVEIAEASLKHWHRKRRRRTRVALAIATVFVVLSSAFAAYSYVLRQRAESALAAEARAKREAQANFQQARKTVNDYLTLVSDSIELSRDLPGLQKFRAELLGKALIYYQGFLKQHADDPALKAEVAEAYARVGLVTAEIGSKTEALSALEAARDLLEGLSRANPTNTDFVRDLATVYDNLGLVQHNLGHPPDAEQNYNKARGIREKLLARSPNDASLQFDLAFTDTNLGLLQNAIGKSTEAEKSLTRARDTGRKLVHKNPKDTKYQISLANTYHALGVLQDELGRQQDAEKSYTDAREIEQKLAAKYPGFTKFESALSGTYNNLGNLQSTTGRPHDAEQSFKQALEIEQKLVAENPSVTEFLNALAATHGNLGNLQSNAGRSKEAMRSFNLAREIEEKLVAQNPSDLTFQNDLASTLNNLAILEQETGRHADARKSFNQARAILEKLVAQSPSVTRLQSALAGAYMHLGHGDQTAGRFADAEQNYAKAITAYEKLAAQNPRVTELQSELARVYHSLGRLKNATGAHAEAEKLFDQAREIEEKLTAQNPTVSAYKNDLALTQLNLGVLFENTNRLADAEKSYQEAGAIWAKLIALYPDTLQFQNDLAATLTNLGSLERNTGRPEVAEKSYNRAREIREKLVARNPASPEFQNDLASTYHNLGMLQSDTHRPRDAEQSYNRAREIREELAAQFPGVPAFQDDLAGTYNNLGVLERAGNHLADAEKSFNRSREIREKLAAQHPGASGLEHSLAMTYTNLGQIQHMAGRPVDAEANLNHAREILEKLVADHPSGSQYISALARSYHHLALVQAATGRPSDADQSFTLAVQYREKAVVLNPSITDYERNLADTLNEAAWFWATYADARSRNGKKALAAATRSCELTQWKSFENIDTLAAASAEAGDFDAAVKWENQAIAMAPEKEKGGLRSRIKLYQERKPYRESAKAR
jgi:tetratricopeptide (TPR) repeat protein